MGALERKKWRVWTLEYAAQVNGLNVSTVDYDNGRRGPSPFDELPDSWYILNDYLIDQQEENAEFHNFLLDYLRRSKGRRVGGMNTTKVFSIRFPGPFDFGVAVPEGSLSVKVGWIDAIVKLSRPDQEQLHRAEVTTYRELKNRADCVYKFKRGFYNISEIRAADTDYRKKFGKGTFASKKSLDIAKKALEFQTQLNFTHDMCLDLKLDDLFCAIMTHAARQDSSGQRVRTPWGT